MTGAGRDAVTGCGAAARAARRLLDSLEGTFAVVPDRSVVLGDRSAAADWALSGAMALTGRADGPPLLGPGAPASVVTAATAVLGALAGDERPSRLPDSCLLGERAAAIGLRRQGPWSVGGSYRPLRTADGWLGLTLARPWDREALPAVLETEVEGDSWAAAAAWAAERPAEQAAARAQMLGIAAAAIPAARPWRASAPFHALRCGEDRAPRRQPLVVDLSALWAGPLCAHLLGLCGARVVKVESAARPDGMRTGSRPFFDLLHAGHESVVLDLADRGGVRDLRRLVHEADVVVESSRPRALAQFGVDAAEAASAGTTWVSVTAYGRSGETANDVGFGDDVAAAAGLVAAACDSDAPFPCGDAIADPLAGAVAAAAALTAVRAGGGWLVDVPMRAVAAWAASLPAGEAVVRRAGGGWQVEDAAGTTHVEPPRARVARAAAAPFGRDTRRVLAELPCR